MRKRINELYHAVARWLEVYDWAWSLPLFGLLYWGVGFVLGGVLGMAVGTFDLSFIQPLFLAIAVVIGGAMAFIYCLRYVFNKILYKYLYDCKGKEDICFENDFINLQAWQRVCLLLLLFCFISLLVVIIFRTIL